MPIDPSIPLAVQPAQPVNPVQNWGQAMSIANLIQQRQNMQMLMQERMVDLQAKQRALDAQNTMGQLIAQHTTVGPDGSVSVDHDAVKMGLAQKGYTPELFKYDADMRANQKAAYDAQEAKQKVYAGQAARLGELGLGVIQAPKELRGEAYAAALRQAAHEGIIPITAAEQAAAQPYTPDTEAQVQQWVNASPAIKNLIEAQRNAREETQAYLMGEQHKAVTTKTLAEIPETKAKAQQAQVTQASSTLLAAAQKGPDDYARAYNAIQDPDIKSRFTDPAKFDPQKTPRDVEYAGLTPEQRAVREQAATTQQATLQYRRDALQSMTAYRNESLELRRERLDQQNVENARSMSADRRQAYSQIQGLEDKEDKLNQSRLQLGSAIGAGDRYITPSGIAKPIDKAAKDEGTTADALREDMKARYRSTTGSLKRVISDKYNQYGRIGISPSVPLDQVNAAIDAGDEQTLGKGTGASSAPVSSPAPAKPAAAPRLAARAPATTQQQPQQAPQAGQRFKNPQTGKIIRWDGKNYIDESTGQPFQQ